MSQESSLHAKGVERASLLTDYDSPGSSSPSPRTSSSSNPSREIDQAFSAGFGLLSQLASSFLQPAVSSSPPSYLSLSSGALLPSSSSLPPPISPPSSPSTCSPLHTPPLSSASLIPESPSWEDLKLSSFSSLGQFSASLELSQPPIENIPILEPALAATNLESRSDPLTTLGQAPAVPTTTTAKTSTTTTTSSSSSSSSVVEEDTSQKSEVNDESQLFGSIMLGFRLSLSALFATPAPSVIVADDFKETRRIDVKKNAGGAAKTPISEHAFVFTEHCPNVFRSLRQSFGIPETDFYLSITQEGFQSTSTNSKSGSAFFFTSDKLYLIKSLTSRELKMLTSEFLSDYHLYMTQKRDSLLSRIVAVFSVSMSMMGFSLHYLVMMNIFHHPRYTTLDEKYDLKGSRIGRTVGVSGAVDPKVVKKDQDFGGRILLCDGHAAALKRILESDCLFLQRTRRIDYSLLIGIVHLEDDETISACSQEMPNRLSHHCFVASKMDGSPFKTVYFFGIIDFIQTFGLLKRVESTYKQNILYDFDPNGVSVVEPNLYSRRLLDYVTSHIGWHHAPQPDPPFSSSSSSASSSSQQQQSSYTNTPDSSPEITSSKWPSTFSSSINQLLTSWSSSSSSLAPIKSPRSADDNGGDPTIVFTGFLEKQGDLRKSWKRRWFTLSQSQVCYHFSDKEQERLGSIPLAGLSVVACPSSRSKTRSFCFELISPERTYLLSASTSEEREAWIGIIEQTTMHLATHLQSIVESSQEELFSQGISS